jgi:hypothetical protein
MRKTTEGSWDQVVQLIGMAHTLTHQQGIARVQTDIRIETRYWVYSMKLPEAQSVLILIHSNRTDKVVQPVGGSVSSVERVFSATT